MENFEQLPHGLEVEPLVGSSRLYRVCPIALLHSSFAGLHPLRLAAAAFDEAEAAGLVGEVYSRVG
jgi:hypothetical protein